jgi:hypothetical protein
VAGFNLIAVVGGEALCLHWDGSLRPAPLSPGVHVLSTGRDVDDPSMPEKQLFEARVPAGAVPDESALAAALASHDGDRPVCKHNGGFGTVSSTIYVEGPARRFLHADGPPCRAPFRDLSVLL